MLRVPERRTGTGQGQFWKTALAGAAGGGGGCRDAEELAQASPWGACKTGGLEHSFSFHCSTCQRQGLLWCWRHQRAAGRGQPGPPRAGAPGRRDMVVWVTIKFTGEGRPESRKEASGPPGHSATGAAGPGREGGRTHAARAPRAHSRVALAPGLDADEQAQAVAGSRRRSPRLLRQRCGRGWGRGGVVTVGGGRGRGGPSHAAPPSRASPTCSVAASA